MQPIDFDGEVCQDPSRAFNKEWLLTNGLGGFASSTIIGANTSKYHGLLIGSLSPPLERMVFLSKLEEEVTYNKKNYLLGTNIYPNTVFPTGYNHIVNFKMDPFPIFTYLINDSIEMEKVITFVHNTNQVVVIYRLLNSNENISLKLSPLIAFRDIHTNTYKNNFVNDEIHIEEEGVWIKPYETLPSMYFKFNSEDIKKTGFWYNSLIYPKEIDKSLSGNEDLFNPFEVLFQLSPGDEAICIASLDKINAFDPDEIVKREIARYHKVAESVSIPNTDSDIMAILLNAADSFIVKKNSRKAIIAGYPWLSERISDSMLALHGLCLDTKKYEDARDILLKVIESYQNGLLPEFFCEKTKEPNYTSIYPSLFFINAVYNYYSYTKDIETLRNPLYYVIQAIINAFSNETVYNIREDKQGLLLWEDPSAAITWGSKTPHTRYGYNVEINAYWYNALKIMAFLSGEMGMNDVKDLFEKRAGKTKDSFNALFPVTDKTYLYDTIYKNTKIDKITPYQIFAISLPFPVLDESLWKGVFDTITKKLLTPYGLRTLSEEDPNFHPKYEGNLNERSVAYYNGVVWTWMIGPYIDAMLRINKNDFTLKLKCLKVLKPIFEHFLDAGLASISELCDGVPGYTPGGCISQAVSVAEVLRVYSRISRL